MHKNLQYRYILRFSSRFFFSVNKRYLVIIIKIKIINGNALVSRVALMNPCQPGTLRTFCTVCTLRGSKIRGWSKILRTRLQARAFILIQFEKESFAPICNIFLFQFFYLYLKGPRYDVLSKSLFVVK